MPIDATICIATVNSPLNILNYQSVVDRNVISTVYSLFEVILRRESDIFDQV
jgi:hypothetical protein